MIFSYPIFRDGKIINIYPLEHYPNYGVSEDAVWSRYLRGGQGALGPWRKLKPFIGNQWGTVCVLVANKPRSIKHLLLTLSVENGNCGEFNAQVKLKERDIPEIFRLREQGWKMLAIAHKYGVHTSTIFLILKRRRWKYLTRFTPSLEMAQ